VACAPDALSSDELERLTRAYTDQMQDLIGPQRDILALDATTDPQVMAWVLDQYSRSHGHSPAVVTGKPLELGGCRGQEDALERGVRLACRFILRDIGMSLAGSRVAVLGSAGSASRAARRLQEEGARVVALADASQGLLHPEGLDLPALAEHQAAGKTFADFPGGRPATRGEALSAECEVLVLASGQGPLEGSAAPAIRAKIVVEAADLAIEPRADELLEKRGIIVVPDLLASAGGVAAGYFEWVQNQQHQGWVDARFDSELDRVLGEAYERVAQLARGRRISLRTSAYAIAVDRVARAVALRGWLRQPRA
jgi:glutamate dehydrogenase (NAD(P)+)